MKKWTLGFLLLCGFAGLSGCAVPWHGQQNKQTGSLVEYLYPKQTTPVAVEPAAMTHLKLPLRVGIAFVPPGNMGYGELPESERLKMLSRVKEAFSHHPFIGGIEVIPSSYLKPRGGFENLEQVSRMFNVDVVALLSYDQMQFSDRNQLSFLYWTIIGAYVIHGNEYDTHTMLDAVVFDVPSRKLLFRAPGTSTVKGAASWATFSERSRGARIDGFNKALDVLIPQLQTELSAFKERVKSDTSVRVQHRPGYTGGGDMGWLGVVLVLLLIGVGMGHVRKLD